jgi:hypothetical protein
MRYNLCCTSTYNIRKIAEKYPRINKYHLVTNPIGTNGNLPMGTIEVNDPIQFLEDICADSRYDVEIIIGKEYKKECKKTGEYYIEIYDNYREWKLNDRCFSSN